jgi:nucleotide-binding universal stress UspA family protein
MMIAASAPRPRQNCDALRMAGTIVIGFDASEGAGRALDHAIAEAKSSGDTLVVVAVFEALLDPEGPQNFGSLSEGARMIPLVEPAELEPIFAKARTRIEAASLEADYVWAVGNPADKIAATARDREAHLVVLAAHHHSFLSRLLGTDVAAEVERELGSSVVVVD